MCPSGELSDGSEPHGLFDLDRGSCSECVDDMGGEGVYPGWCSGWYQEGAIPGTQQGPDLRLI